MHLTPFATSRRDQWCRAKSGCGPIVQCALLARRRRAAATRSTEVTRALRRCRPWASHDVRRPSRVPTMWQCRVGFWFGVALLPLLRPGWRRRLTGQSGPRCQLGHRRPAPGHCRGGRPARVAQSSCGN